MGKMDSEWVGEYVARWIHRGMNGWTDGRIYESVGRWVVGWMIDEWVMSGWTDRWLDRLWMDNIYPFNHLRVQFSAVMCLYNVACPSLLSAP